ncbi:MAG: hypothetical protein IKT77_06510, partial [Paludibacteraceae bacterium]|nr:hypothetical protein [Paludibacteraceae bacterium]
VYGKPYPEQSKFYLKFDNENPKEATAKGGLEATNEQAIVSPELIVLMGSDNQTFASNETFDTITDEQKNAIIKNVKDFIRFIPTLNTKQTLGNIYNLDVKIFDDVIGICEKNLDGYLDLGIDKVKKLLSQDTTKTNDITESLFFYPIVGMLNNLAQELYELDVNS